VIVGALIIKELFDYSDDEKVENLMLDFRIQYALHNKDLYHDCVKDLSASIVKLMGISGKVRRMDSMMIESNIRKLSRMELIYTCILRNGVETVPSNIRKNYHLEKMPRGKQRGKFSFGSKIAALNFRKPFNYVKGLGHYAQNPVLA
jgi:hypothetical protein